MYMYVMQDAGLGERGPALLEERCFEEGGEGLRAAEKREA